jgi:hypothetical protein
MKKILIALMIVAGAVSMGLAQAKGNDNNNGNNKNYGDIKPNITGVATSDLKQRIQIEETSSGNTVWLTGAKIVEINTTASSSVPNLIKVKIFGQDYKVKIASDTNVVRQYWGKSEVNLSEFSVGDIVNVYGTLDSSDYFSVNAKTVRNVSIQKLQAVLNGEISTIASSSSSFVMQTKKSGTTTVTTSSSTKIYSGKDLKSFSDLQTGMKVTVRGVWDKTLSTIQALLIRMNPQSADKGD